MPIFGTHVNYRPKGGKDLKRISFTEQDHADKAIDFSSRLISTGTVDFIELHPFQLKDEATNG